MFHPGFVCYGIPVRSDEYIRHILGKKVSEVRGEVDRVNDVLDPEDS